MNSEKLQEILEKHELWLENNEEEERADLREADLQEANLQWADLQGANLQEANLRGADLKWADLRGADLDFSCWPLWCGSLDIKVDARIARQLAYHLCRLDCDDEEYLRAREAIKDFANKFHRVDECGGIVGQAAEDDRQPTLRSAT